MAQRRRGVQRRPRRGGGVAVSAPTEDTRTTLKCAFCDGTGKDPWGLMSVLSACQVCLGRGSIRLQEPTGPCAFCGGTGIHLGQRLTCLACGGKGRVTVPEPAETCPTCDGQGADHFGLYCLTCRGRGVVPVKVVA